MSKWTHAAEAALPHQKKLLPRSSPRLNTSRLLPAQFFPWMAAVR